MERNLSDCIESHHVVLKPYSITLNTHHTASVSIEYRKKQRLEKNSGMELYIILSYFNITGGKYDYKCEIAVLRLLMDGVVD